MFKRLELDNEYKAKAASLGKAFYNELNNATPEGKADKAMEARIKQILETFKSSAIYKLASAETIHKQTRNDKIDFAKEYEQLLIKSRKQEREIILLRRELKMIRAQQNLPKKNSNQIHESEIEPPVR